MIRFFVSFISLVLILTLPETSASFSILKFFLVLGIVTPLLSWILQFYSNFSKDDAAVISLSDHFTQMRTYVTTNRKVEMIGLSQNVAIKIKGILFPQEKQLNLKKILSIGIPSFIVATLLFQWLTPRTALPPLEKITLGNRSFLIPKEWSVISHDKKMHQIIFGNQDESERIGIMNPIFMSPDTFFTNAVNSEIENLELRNKKIISQYRTYHAAASLLEYDHINGERYTTLLDFTRLGKYKYKMSWIDMPKIRFYDSQAIRLLPIAANGFSLERIDKNGKYHLDIAKPKKPYQYDTLPLLSSMFRYRESGLLTVKAPIGWQLQAEMLSSMFVYRKQDSMLIDDVYYPANLPKKLFYKDKATGKQHKYPYAKVEYENAILQVTKKLGLDNILTVYEAQDKPRYIHFKEIQGNINGKKMQVSVILFSGNLEPGIGINMFVAPEKQYHQLGGKYLLITTLLGYEPAFHQHNHLPHPNTLNAQQFLTQYVNFARSKYSDTKIPEDIYSKYPGNSRKYIDMLEKVQKAMGNYPAVRAGQSAIGN
ncbi:MAG: hypothetical protein V3U87_15435 [Methylococcaceae bacterium]